MIFSFTIPFIVTQSVQVAPDLYRAIITGGVSWRELSIAGAFGVTSDSGVSHQINVLRREIEVESATREDGRTINTRPDPLDHKRILRENFLVRNQINGNKMAIWT